MRDNQPTSLAQLRAYLQQQSEKAKAEAAQAAERERFEDEQRKRRETEAADRKRLEDEQRTRREQEQLRQDGQRRLLVSELADRMKGGCSWAHLRSEAIQTWEGIYGLSPSEAELDDLYRAANWECHGINPNCSPLAKPGQHGIRLPPAEGPTGRAVRVTRKRLDQSDEENPIEFFD